MWGQENGQRRFEQPATKIVKALERREAEGDMLGRRGGGVKGVRRGEEKRRGGEGTRAVLWYPFFSVAALRFVAQVYPHHIWQARILSSAFFFSFNFRAPVCSDFCCLMRFVCV